MTEYGEKKLNPWLIGYKDLSNASSQWDGYKKQLEKWIKNIT
jgi:hypothetical protein